MRTGDQGVHRGIARSSAAPAMSKPTAATKPRIIGWVAVYERPAMSAAVQVQQFKEALHLAAAEIGGPNGRKMRDQIFGPFDQLSMTRPAWGEYEFSPTAPPA